MMMMMMMITRTETSTHSMPIMSTGKVDIWRSPYADYYSDAEGS